MALSKILKLSLCASVSSLANGDNSGTYLIIIGMMKWENAYKVLDWARAWLTPAVPALWEAEAGGSLESGSS